MRKSADGAVGVVQVIPNPGVPRHDRDVLGAHLRCGFEVVRRTAQIARVDELDRVPLVRSALPGSRSIARWYSASPWLAGKPCSTSPSPSAACAVLEFGSSATAALASEIARGRVRHLTDEPDHLIVCENVEHVGDAAWPSALSGAALTTRAK